MEGKMIIRRMEPSELLKEKCDKLVEAAEKVESQNGMSVMYLAGQMEGMASMMKAMERERSA